MLVNIYLTSLAYKTHKPTNVYLIVHIRVSKIFSKAFSHVIASLNSRGSYTFDELSSGEGCANASRRDKRTPVSGRASLYTHSTRAERSYNIYRDSAIFSRHQLMLTLDQVLCEVILKCLLPVDIYIC